MRKTQQHVKDIPIWADEHVKDKLKKKYMLQACKQFNELFNICVILYNSKIPAKLDINDN